MDAILNLIFSEFIWITIGAILGFTSGWLGFLVGKGTHKEKKGFIGHLNFISFIITGVIGAAISGLADLVFLTSHEKYRTGKMMLTNGFCCCFIAYFTYNSMKHRN